MWPVTTAAVRVAATIAAPIVAPIGTWCSITAWRSLACWWPAPAWRCLNWFVPRVPGLVFVRFHILLLPAPWLGRALCRGRACLVGSMFTACMLPERLNFLFYERAPRAGSKILEAERTFAYTYEPQDLVAQQASYFADLALAPLVEHYPNPGSFIAAFEQLNPGWRGALAFEIDASTPLAQRIGIGRLVEQYSILLLDLEARVRQPIGQLTVIGEQQQPFAILVEPPNWEQPRRVIDQVDHCLAALGVFCS